MNATELADELENTYPFVGVMEIAATMLRQQQAEIEALKMDIHSLTYGERLTKYFNKPVAYGKYIENAKMWLVVELNADMPEGYIPLYTHPVSKAKDRFPNYESICLQCGTTIYKPFKELTDEDRSMLIRTLKWAEDLLRVAGHEEAVSDVQDCLMIIRKAQEK